MTSRSGLLLVGLIIAIVSFVAGMRLDAIAGAFAPMFGGSAKTAGSSGSLDLGSVQETYRALKAHYDGELDEEQLILGASRGLVEAAGDEHTAFLDPEAVKELEMSLSGSIGGGIGAEIGLRNQQPTVIRPLPNTPAAKSGLLAGDVVLSVNDVDVTGMAVDEVVQKIRGDIGTTVKLVVWRGEEKKEFSIVRQEITSPPVEASVDGEIGILAVHRFNEETGPLARAEAEKFLSQGVKKVILDLRYNLGGEVSAAQALAGLWLDRQVILTHRRGELITQTDKSTGTPILGDMKTTILINGSSASASEIIAGALKEYGKATLVGEKTYGKGSVQAVLRLGGGAQLKVTESRWYTPKGKNIDKEGIAPDVEVKLTPDDVNANRDLQLEKAKEL